MIEEYSKPYQKKNPALYVPGAFMDLYRALSEEQKERLRACRSLSEMQTFARTENIVLTEDQLEAFAGYRELRKGRIQKDDIETGLFGRFICLSEEWQELVDEAREQEMAIRRRFPSEKEQESAARKLIAGPGRALQMEENSASFVESCLSLRGSFREGRLRRIIREQARLLEYLADGAPIPDSAQGLLGLWETAHRREPRFLDTLPAHFRSSDDRVPFAHGKGSMGYFEPGPVSAGFETSPWEEIPEAVDRLVEWMHRPDLPRELAAFSTCFLLIRIHPFPDGNGHTARLLCCGMLASDYSAATLAALIGLEHECRRSVFNAAMLAELSDGNLCEPCCTLIRLMIRGQKRLLSA